VSAESSAIDGSAAGEGDCGVATCSGGGAEPNHWRHPGARGAAAVSAGAGAAGGTSAAGAGEASAGGFLRKKLNIE
jgi:hypothetical protein